MSTLSSKAVAEMLGKRHDNFMRNLRSYAATLGESASEYLIESTYKDGKGKVRAGYEITLKGCDLIAGRIIGATGEVPKGMYTYKEIQYEKDEYIKLMADKNAVLEKQATDIQMALTEVYEMML